MIVSIAQPAYLPWLGYFDRIHRSDLAIILDDVQFERRGFTHRNQIKGQDGSLWLTVPVNRKGNFYRNINKLTVNNDSNWRKKHWNRIRHCYSKAPFWPKYASVLEQLFQHDRLDLASLLTDSTAQLFCMLGIKTKTVFSSEMKAGGIKSERILNLCLEVGAKVYVSGPFGRDYLDAASFSRAGIKLMYHDYQHPTYTQLYKGFCPFMSVIDLLFNHGPDSLRKLSNNQEFVNA